MELEVPVEAPVADPVVALVEDPVVEAVPVAEVFDEPVAEEEPEDEDPPLESSSLTLAGDKFSEALFEAWV